MLDVICITRNTTSHIPFVQTLGQLEQTIGRSLQREAAHEDAEHYTIEVDGRVFYRQTPVQVEDFEGEPQWEWLIEWPFDRQTVATR